jgi:hypothetical protein
MTCIKLATLASGLWPPASPSGHSITHTQSIHTTNNNHTNTPFAKYYSLLGGMGVCGGAASPTRENIYHTSLVEHHNIARGHGGAQRPPQGNIYLPLIK